MPHLLDRVAVSQSPKRSTHVDEQALVGSHKVSYRKGADWDFEAETDSAPINISLVMPAHRPKHQPESHRMNMLVASESGPIRIKLCRHCLHRSFNLKVSGGYSDVVIWVPSNFNGVINYDSPSKATFSAGFANHILSNASINPSSQRDLRGDKITVLTDGSVTFRMWDIFTMAPEVPHKEMWKRVFKPEKRVTNTPAWNWDFLLEDDDS